MLVSFIQDLGLISIILLVSFFLRHKIGLLQRLFIPVSILAGLLSLSLGNYGLGYLQFSDQLGNYPGIMIAFLFASLPFTLKKREGKSKTFKRDTIQIGGTALVILLLQWGTGVLFGLTVLHWLFPEINAGFGAILATGFFGGHGTAAAIGESFATNLNWEAAKSLAMTSATVGIFSATIGGVILVQWGVKKNKTAFIKDFNTLPNSLKTGLIPLKEQHSMGKSTFSNIAINPLLMHFVLVLFVGISGMYLTEITKPLLNGYSIAAFSFAFIVGLLLKWALTKLQYNHYFDPQVMNGICGLFADLIVVFGIASIKIDVIVNFAVPLLLLFGVGIGLALFCFRVMGPKVFSSFWFEKSLFLWGMSLGITAMGIALLRMVDSESKSETLPSFALGYLTVSPFEVAGLVFFPIMVNLGLQWPFAISCLFFGILLFILLKRYNKKTKTD